jgi:hypothetical protein
LLTAWNYAIVHAALQAKRELLERNLNAREIRRHLTLMRLGRQGTGRDQNVEFVLRVGMEGKVPAGRELVEGAIRF